MYSCYDQFSNCARFCHAVKLTSNFFLQLFVSSLNESSLITIVASLLPPTFVSENDTISYIRQEVCNETRLKEIFYFPNKSVSDRVHDELCGLSPDQFYTLAEDFVQDFDPVAFEEEVFGIFITF